MLLFVLVIGTRRAIGFHKFSSVLLMFGVLSFEFAAKRSSYWSKLSVGYFQRISKCRNPQKSS